ncbi:MAG: biotin/lipoyl-binding protein [Gammaproteobacteria bacterium]|nr:biotin/lipoyl-binding protein [Gammaproteobacteria bacterium]
MSTRKALKILLPFIALGIAAALMYEFIISKPERKQQALQEKVWQVDVISTSKQSLSPSITLYGLVESPEILQAAAPGAGIVDKVMVRVGDTVKKDQTLVALDRRDFESLLLQAEAELKDIDSQHAELKIHHKSNLVSLKTEQELFKLAEHEVGRMRKLKNQNLGADSALSDARSALAKQQLSLHSRQFEVESFPAKLQKLEALQIKYRARLGDAQLMLERSQAIAPFDGIISSVPVSKGDRVAIGQTLVSLYPDDSLEIRAHIPAVYITAIQSSIDQGVAPQAQLADNAETLLLNLKRLAGEAKATGIDAYFQVATSTRQLRPGALLPLSLALPPQPDVFAVPFQAIYGNSRIYRLSDDRLEGIDVKTVGQFYPSADQALLLVQSDLIRDGDKIVITHLPNAVSGLKVKTAKQ